MSVTRDKSTGKWMSQVRVKDWTGKEIHKKKRGFNTKKEALQWERDFISQADGSLGMKFKDFVALYMKDADQRHQADRYSQLAKRADSLPPSQRQMLFADLFANHQQPAHRSLQLCSEVLWTEREPMSQGGNHG